METEKTEDPISPSHYAALGATCGHCGEAIEPTRLTRQMGFNLGNAVKYACRAPFKGVLVEDLNKSAWYINDEIKKQGGTPRFVDSRLQVQDWRPLSEEQKQPGYVWGKPNTMTLTTLMKRIGDACPTLVTRELQEIEGVLEPIIEPNRPNDPPAPVTLAEVSVHVTLTREERERTVAILKDYVGGANYDGGYIGAIITKLENA